MQTDFNGQVVVQNYVKKNECVDCAKQVTKCAAFFNLIVVLFKLKMNNAISLLKKFW